MAELAETSYPKGKIKVLLLENLHENGIQLFQNEGFEIQKSSKSMTKEELIETIKDVHIIGLRSKTQLTSEVLSHAKRLLAIGCFCIGTNQVDLNYAEELGIPVFNSPYANSRSVAELIIAQVISLSRQLGDRNREIHEGVWNKVSANCHEIRGKTLGIVGYGHIGSQLSVLAEAMGMRVIFNDIIPKLALGNAIQTESLEDLLGRSDFVSLHVPATPETEYMIGKKQIAAIKPGGFLLNASRGNVCVVEEIAAALQSGHLAGAYVDVFPKEPKGNGPGFETPLRGLANVLLSPHIGGSTEEAQASIGSEVASKLIRFVNEGCSLEAVNFPAIDLGPRSPKFHRILNVHRNVPGVLRDINRILESVNVRSQVLATTGSVGYMIISLDQGVSADIKKSIAALPTSIRTRILF
jgi:D-3-phosphoglycerate dehydrogenase